MADYICIDVDKLKGLLPWLITQISAEGKCGGAAPEPTPEPVEPPPADKPVKILTDYVWEDSDLLVPGKAILIPHQSLTGDILNASVNDEQLTFHSVWSNGREIWCADHSVAYYGNASLEIETSHTIYRSKAEGIPNVPTGSEQLKYHGRHNGDRPTWYGSKNMRDYPPTIRVVIPGCVDKVIPNNGTRYDDGKLIVKQSDVSGRGVAVVFHASCRSTTAYIKS